MRRISLHGNNVMGWVLDAGELILIILGALAMGERFYDVFGRLNLPTWARVFISVMLVIVVFVGVGYLRNRRKGKVSGKKGVMVSEQGQEPTIIKDARIRVAAEKASKATGMRIDNVPSELSGVQINVEAEDVKEVTGLKISGENTRFAAKATMIICSCGHRFGSFATCGHEEKIKCPKCGKEY